MLISSDVEKQTSLNFVCGSYPIMQEKQLSVEFRLMVISSDAEKQIWLKFLLC